VVTILSNQEPAYVRMTLGKGDTLQIRRLKGGYSHWARVQSIGIVGERMHVWFTRSCDRKSKFLAFAGMDPAFAVEIAPGVWTWISDPNNFSKHEVKLTLSIPSDLTYWIEKA
jgi:hypothetical protein